MPPEVTHESPPDSLPSIPTVQNGALVRRAESLSSQLATAQVTDQHALAVVNELIGASIEMRKELDGHYHPILDAARKTVDSIRQAKASLYDPLEKGEALARKQVAAFLLAEQRRVELETAQTAKANAQEIKEHARDLARAGEKEAAAALRAAPTLVTAPPPTIAPQGVSLREDWKFQVVDAALVPREYLIVDEKKVGAVVRASKGQQQIPGIRVWAEAGITKRS